MPVKIEYYMSFDDAFKQSPDLVWSVASKLLSGQSLTERFALLDGMVTAAADAHQDDQLLVLLQMHRKLAEETWKAIFVVRTDFLYDAERDRASEKVAALRYKEYLAELFWKLPDSRREQTYVRDQDGSRYEDGHVTLQALPATKRFIFRELMKDWTATPSDASVHAFRRVIAMGWPLSDQFKSKFDGEHDIELKARGRHIGSDEQKQYASAVRSHLETFGSYEDKQKGADALFGPWLAQKRVPEDIEKMLVIARAKMGGAAMARRDIERSAVLEGIPESAVDIIRSLTDNMRVWRAEIEWVFAEVLVEQRKRYPYWRGTKVPYTLECGTLNGILISVDGCADAAQMSAMFIDVSAMLTAAKTRGMLQGCVVSLQVTHSELRPLTNSWSSQ